MKFWNNLILLIVIIGCLNWGLIGIFKFDLLAFLFAGSSLFGTINAFTRILYTIVGLCGLYAISFFGSKNTNQ